MGAKNASRGFTHIAGMAKPSWKTNNWAVPTTSIPRFSREPPQAMKTAPND